MGVPIPLYLSPAEFCQRVDSNDDDGDDDDVSSAP